MLPGSDQQHACFSMTSSRAAELALEPLTPSSKGPPHAFRGHPMTKVQHVLRSKQNANPNSLCRNGTFTDPPPSFVRRQIPKRRSQ